MRIASSSPLLLVFQVLLLGASAFLPCHRAPFSLLPRPRHHRPAATQMQAATSSPLLQHLQAAFPRVSIPLEFVDGIAASDSSSSSSSPSGGAESSGSPEEQQALVRARTFASLAPRVLLARGLDTISDDFSFFSPSESLICMYKYRASHAFLRFKPQLTTTPPQQSQPT